MYKAALQDVRRLLQAGLAIDPLAYGLPTSLPSLLVEPNFKLCVCFLLYFHLVVISHPLRFLGVKFSGALF